MDKRTKEALRYLGYGKKEVDEKILFMIKESFEELEKIGEMRNSYRFFEVSEKDDELQFANLQIKSKSLKKNLKGCTWVVLFGATMGFDVDRRIRTYEFTDMAKAVVMQACAASMLEEYCDNVQDEIAMQLSAKKMHLRPRFSPGYGDFSLQHQEKILSMLDASKTIGLSLTDGYMLIPTKSITAVIGVSERG